MGYWDRKARKETGDEVDEPGSQICVAEIPVGLRGILGVATAGLQRPWTCGCIKQTLTQTEGERLIILRTIGRKRTVRYVVLFTLSELLAVADGQRSQQQTP